MLNTALYEGTLTLEAVLAAKKTRVLMMDLAEFLAYKSNDERYCALTKAQLVLIANPNMGIKTVWQFLVVPKKLLIKRCQKMGAGEWSEVCRLVDLWPNERPNFPSFQEWQATKILAATMKKPITAYVDNTSNQGRIRRRFFLDTKNQLVFTGELQTRLGIDVDAFVKNWI